MPDRDSLIRSLIAQRKIFMLLNVAAAIAVAVLFWTGRNQQQQITHQNNVIQEERYNAVLRACTEQNARHDSTVEALDLLLKSSGVSAARRAQSRANTLLLINALAPKRDCLKLAKTTVPSS